MYDAGQSASLDNVAYGYDQEGVIAWDLPRTFDFEEKGDHIANVIEKFSDFGQSITSKKYKGKTQQVRGHTIVFSNREPLEQLAHRDIVHINLEKEIPPQGKGEVEASETMHNDDEVATEYKYNTKMTHILSKPCEPTIEDKGNKYRVKHYSNGKNRISYTETYTEAEKLVEEHKLNIDYLKNKT
jgi:hypothetical protein